MTAERCKYVVREASIMSRGALVARTVLLSDAILLADTLSRTSNDKSYIVEDANSLLHTAR